MGSSTRRTAGCGPACPVVVGGEDGQPSPLSRLDEEEILSVDLVRLRNTWYYKMCRTLHRLPDGSRDTFHLLSQDL
jgi:hypothetical protein